MKRLLKPKLLAAALAGIVLISGMGLALSDPGWTEQTDGESTIDQQDQPALADGQASQQQDTTTEVPNSTHSESYGEHNLTDEQQAELQAMVEGMREDGANRSEIRRAVTDKLGTFGVDTGDKAMPEDHPKTSERSDSDERSGSHGQMNLTDEQQAELQAMVKEMREDGANRSEIRRAVMAEFRSTGVNGSNHTASRNNPMGDSNVTSDERAGFGEQNDLTDEQRTELQNTVQQMRENGATQEEIRRAIDDQLASYGVNRTAFPASDQHRRGCG